MHLLILPNLSKYRDCSVYLLAVRPIASHARKHERIQREKNNGWQKHKDEYNKAPQDCSGGEKPEEKL